MPLSLARLYVRSVNSLPCRLAAQKACQAASPQAAPVEALPRGRTLERGEGARCREHRSRRAKRGSQIGSSRCECRGRDPPRSSRCGQWAEDLCHVPNKELHNTVIENTDWDGVVADEYLSCGTSLSSGNTAAAHSQRSGGGVFSIDDPPELRHVLAGCDGAAKEVVTLSSPPPEALSSHARMISSGSNVTVLDADEYINFNVGDADAYWKNAAASLHSMGTTASSEERTGNDDHDDMGDLKSESTGSSHFPFEDEAKMEGQRLTQETLKAATFPPGATSHREEFRIATSFTRKPATSNEPACPVM